MADHADLEGWIGEAAGYFPATATDAKPAAAAVDAWYTGPVADVCTATGCSGDLVKNSLAHDLFKLWLWRHRTNYANEKEVAGGKERWEQTAPKFPSEESRYFMQLELGAIDFQ